jgi:hypothetical protein
MSRPAKTLHRVSAVGPQNITHFSCIDRKKTDSRACPVGIKHPIRASAHGRREEFTMRLGASLFLIAVGAILKFAVTDTVQKIDLGVVGIILMVVGLIGLLAEAIFWGTRRRTTVVRQEPPLMVDDPALRRRSY